MIAYHSETHGSLENLLDQGYRRVSNKYRMIGVLVGDVQAQLNYLKSIGHVVSVDELHHWTNWLIRCGDPSIVQYVYDIPYLEYKRFPLAN